jgi:hypothetical protein
MPRHYSKPPYSNLRSPMSTFVSLPSTKIPKFITPGFILLTLYIDRQCVKVIKSVTLITAKVMKTIAIVNSFINSL